MINGFTCFDNSPGQGNRWRKGDRERADSFSELRVLSTARIIFAGFWRVRTIGCPGVTKRLTSSVTFGCPCGGLIIGRFSRSSDVRSSIVQRIRVGEIGYPYLCQSHCFIVVFITPTIRQYDELSKHDRPCGSATPFLQPLSPSSGHHRRHIPRGELQTLYWLEQLVFAQHD
ncbi:hypothetical protein EDC04DRAFT_161324 [Pisolithus marmoratus]|nr:hypothetical protein EDC04DRAFT_161324 [Pisolithus marmoratus]